MYKCTLRRGVCTAKVDHCFSKSRVSCVASGHVAFLTLDLSFHVSFSICLSTNFQKWHSFPNCATDFSALLEAVNICSGKLIILGDFNIHMENKSEPNTQLFSKLFESFDLVQHVAESTHKKGHIHDLFITRSNESPLDILVDDPGISDHCSVNFSMNLTKPALPTKNIQYRKIKSINSAKFMSDICTSLLDSYNIILGDLLDKYALSKQITITVHPTAP